MILRNFYNLCVKPLSVNSTKWLNTLKQFVGCCQRIVRVCFWPFCGVGFGHFKGSIWIEFSVDKNEDKKNNWACFIQNNIPWFHAVTYPKIFWGDRFQQGVWRGAVMHPYGSRAKPWWRPGGKASRSSKDYLFSLKSLIFH